MNFQNAIQWTNISIRKTIIILEGIYMRKSLKNKIKTNLNHLKILLCGKFKNNHILFSINTYFFSVVNIISPNQDTHDILIANMLTKLCLSRSQLKYVFTPSSYYFICNIEIVYYICLMINNYNVMCKQRWKLNRSLPLSLSMSLC